MLDKELTDLAEIVLDEEDLPEEKRGFLASILGGMAEQASGLMRLQASRETCGVPAGVACIAAERAWRMSNR